MKSSPAAGRQLSFQADLENWAEGMDYCAVPVPAEITEALGTKGPVLVMAQVNDSEPFQVSLFPGRGWPALHSHQGKGSSGDEHQDPAIAFECDSPSLIVRTWTIPDDLMRALMAEGVTEAFKSLPPGKQNFIIRRIDDAVKPETREKRIQEGVVAAHQARERAIDKDSPS